MRSITEESGIPGGFDGDNGASRTQSGGRGGVKRGDTRAARGVVETEGGATERFRTCLIDFGGCGFDGY